MKNDEFVNAVKSGSIASIYDETFGMLCDFLKSKMRADNADAQDCAQNAIVEAINRINENKIREPKYIYKYLIRTARNMYLRIQSEQKRSACKDNMQPYVPVEEEIDLLVSQEREKAFQSCRKELPEQYRKLLDFFLDYPDAATRDAADHFGISPNNVWTRKCRLRKKLSECIEKKTNL